MTALVARHLKKAYQGRDVVSELSLLVSPGEIVGLLVPTVQVKLRAFI